jgi:DNA/RNA endonuclease G (NUC1)
MRAPMWVVVCLALSLGATSCLNASGPPSPGALDRRASSLSPAAPAVRFSEIHYDNAGNDVQEALEISGPAGAEVTGWTIVLYNGGAGGNVVYDTKTLTGAIPATCGDRGVVVVSYPANGIQNGGTTVAGTADPDGMALVDAGGAVVEFLSYEGTIAATTGPAAGLTSNDIGVRELGTTAEGLGKSLQRDGAGTWSAPAPNSLGACNDSGVSPPPPPPPPPPPSPPPPPPAGLPATRVTEIHYDNSGADVNEAIEIEGPAGADLNGWSIVLYDGNGGPAYGTTALAGTIPATCDGRGVVVVNYPQNGIQNGSPDGFALVDAGGQVVELLSYEGTFTATDGPASGMVSTDIGAAEAASSPVGASLQRDGLDHWALGTATFGACNGSGAPPPPPPPAGNTIAFSGRLPGDPALPVGFQDQLFATVRDGSNAVVATTVTWSSETPALASVDQSGVITSLAEGSATFRATAADGVTTATLTLPLRFAVASTTARYAGNAELGEPADADPSDDFIVRHAQYTASYNPNRGTPNWVSYDLEATHFGAEDRCDCFTFDPDLPASFPRYTTADYTGAAAIAGYGIDRGHMTRSFDRTSASLDNAFTFYFSNVVPQASDLNQGPWAILENDLGDLARFADKEVYIIAGVAGNKGTLKNEGKIVIPASTWKVAVIMPRDHGLADVVDYRDVEVIAVNMPNDPGVRNVPWQTYQTNVDAIEALTGYDLLALLPDKVQAAVEAGVKPPLAFADGPYTATEGNGAVAMSAAASIDPNGSVVAYDWSFGDGATATGPIVAHAYAQDGVYAVRLIVTDNDGLTDTILTSVTVANVAPAIAPFAGATLVAPATYAADGSFADPGADLWTGTVDYGDGSGVGPLALTGTAFALSHSYGAAGSFTVTVRIGDGQATASATQTVTVSAPPPPPPPAVTPAQALAQATAVVGDLVAAGKISRPIGALLARELAIASLGLDRGRRSIAVDVLRAVLVELDLLARFGTLSAADALPLRTLVGQVIAAIEA